MNNFWFVIQIKLTLGDGGTIKGGRVGEIPDEVLILGEFGFVIDTSLVSGIVSAILLMDASYVIVSANKCSSWSSPSNSIEIDDVVEVEDENEGADTEANADAVTVKGAVVDVEDDIVDVEVEEAEIGTGARIEDETLVAATAASFVLMVEVEVAPVEEVELNAATEDDDAIDD